MVIQTVLSKNLERNLFSLKKKKSFDQGSQTFGLFCKIVQAIKILFLKKNPFGILAIWSLHTVKSLFII